MLILDNHDDFGGHAKRNEFTLDGRTLIGFGGTMFIDAPRGYPAAAKQVLRDIGIDAERFCELSQRQPVSRTQARAGQLLRPGHVRLGLPRDGFQWVLRHVRRGAAVCKWQSRISKRLFTDETDYLAGMAQAERRALLESISYRDYLEKYAGSSAEALAFLQKVAARCLVDRVRRTAGLDGAAGRIPGFCGA